MYRTKLLTLQDAARSARAQATVQAQELASLRDICAGLETPEGARVRETLPSLATVYADYVARAQALEASTAQWEQVAQRAEQALQAWTAKLQARDAKRAAQPA